MHVLVLSLFVLETLVAGVVASNGDPLQGTIRTQEGTTCQWRRLDYTEGSTVRRFHLDCSCLDHSGEDAKYSCTYQGNLGKCLTDGVNIDEQEKRAFRELTVEARGTFKNCFVHIYNTNCFFLEQDHACTEDVLHVYCAGTGEVIMMSLLDAESKGDPKVCATHYRPHDYRHEEL